MPWKLLVVLALFSSSLWGQVNADSLYAEARKLAQDKEYASARVHLHRVLRAYPDYHEVRNYLARTFAWEEQFDSASFYYDQSLRKAPNYADTYNGWTDLSLWQDEYYRAIAKADSGLAMVDSTEQTPLKIRKAKAQYALGQFVECYETLEPVDEGANGLKRAAMTRIINHSIDITASVEAFSSRFDPMWYSTLQAGQSTKYGVGIVRLNWAQRFETSGLQGEIDLYPKITDRIYLYANYGYSTAEEVFPRHRAGLELYSAIGSAWEGSLGGRVLHFTAGETSSNIVMYTASMAYYVNDYWLSIRPFVIPQEDGTEANVSLLARRYLRTPGSWITLRAGYGFSPDARRIQIGAGENIAILQSFNAGINWQQSLGNGWILLSEVGFTQQDLPQPATETLHIYTATLGLKRLL